MKECSKSIARRLADADFTNRYFVGEGLDVGGKPDPLALYLELFPRAAAIRTWDREDGDAQQLAGVADERYGFVHASHCLEHLHDPREGLANWFRVVAPGGHLVVTVPDEDLYEQGTFPASAANRDHRHTFTIWKARSWSPASINVLDLVPALGPRAQVVRLALLESTYRYALPSFDQSLTPVAECGIELVVRKRPVAEVVAGGRLPGDAQPAREMRIHLNQYRDDVARMKAANVDSPPFGNDRDV